MCYTAIIPAASNKPPADGPCPAHVRSSTRSERAPRSIVHGRRLLRWIEKPASVLFRSVCICMCTGGRAASADARVAAPECSRSTFTGGRFSTRGSALSAGGRNSSDALERDEESQFRAFSFVGASTTFNYRGGIVHIRRRPTSGRSTALVFLRPRHRKFLEIRVIYSINRASFDAPDREGVLIAFPLECTFTT